MEPVLLLPAAALAILEQMPVSEGLFNFDEHPWINEVFGNSMAGDARFDVLREKKWPAVLMHGDFAPWNIIRRKADVGVRQEALGRRQGEDKPMPIAQCPVPNAQCPMPMALCAIDWENGFLQGFFGMDAIHYVLQVALHVEHRDPAESGATALAQGRGLNGVSDAEVVALIQLCAEWLCRRDGAESAPWYKQVMTSF